MKKPNTTKLKVMARRIISRVKSRQLKLIDRDARHGDLELVKMHSNDLADVVYICHEAINGNYLSAGRRWVKLDTPVAEVFPNCFLNLLEKAGEYEYNYNGEQ
jgi:hypothetical protein